MKNQTKIEEVAHIDISIIDDFEGHPFTVKDDESMEELTHSIEENGILNPIFYRHLCLSVGTEIGKGSVFSNLSQP